MTREESHKNTGEIVERSEAIADNASVVLASDDDYQSTSNLVIDGERHMMVENLNLRYGSAQALYNVSVPIEKNAVTSFIGPSGCGKSTLLRCLNRMNDLIPICNYDGSILLEGTDINQPGMDLVTLRRRVGMLFQKLFEVLLCATRISHGAVAVKDIQKGVAEDFLVFLCFKAFQATIQLG